MRMTAVVAAIASCAVIFTVQTAHADALSPVELAFEDSPTLINELAIEKQEQEQEIAKEVQKKKKVTYTVKSGDTLISIAKDQDTTWKRLFYKNKSIKNPDILKIGDKVTIPTKDEKLKKRELPAREIQVQVNNSSTNTSSNQQNTTRSQPVASSTRGSTAGNLYGYGYCTWYVKNRRPDLPNNLGNANTWASRAAAQGYATGSTPRVGAVAQALTGTMHVAIVEAVHSNGTVTVSEMNFKGWNVVSSRTTSASSFMYIY